MREEQVSPSRWGQKTKQSKTPEPDSQVPHNNPFLSIFPSVAASTGHDCGILQDSSSQTLLS